MTAFVRVKSADGPDTEYLAPESLVKANPGLYVRIGVKHVAAVEAEPVKDDPKPSKK